MFYGCDEEFLSKEFVECYIQVTLIYVWVFKYRIFARIRRTFFRAKSGQNWGVRLICELDLKLFFLPKFFNFCFILKHNLNYCFIYKFHNIS